MPGLRDLGFGVVGICRDYVYWDSMGLYRGDLGIVQGLGRVEGFGFKTSGVVFSNLVYLFGISRLSCCQSQVRVYGLDLG